MAPVTTPDVNPLVLKDVLLRLGSAETGKDFRKHVDQVTLTPSSSPITWTGLGGNTHSDVPTATWVANVNYVQDWDDPDSLSRFLFENEGAEVPVVFEPKSGGAAFESVAIITPGAVGGQVNSYATTSVTLGLKSKPVLVTD